MSEYILEVKNLCKSFGAVRATDTLTMKIRKGEVHALIGPNGAGKTTLVNQLSGNLMPDSGQVLFNGRDITSIKPYRRARAGLSRSFQITSVFEHMTVSENLALAILAHEKHNFRFFRNWMKAKAVIKKLPAALAMVGLSERGDLAVHQLSHGEKRQLEAGMAIAGAPALLMLDEPMAGMGPGGTVEMSKLIRRLKREMTILLVEHDMEVVFSLADRITVLVYGAAIAHGTPDEIKNNAEVKKAYLGENQDA